MHNPKALKFNASKKLAQLEKVIQIFQCQIADRVFQIEFLHGDLDPSINSNLAAYESRMVAIQNSADSERDDLLQKVERLYKRKTDQLAEECQNFVRAQESTLEQFCEKLSDDITDLLKHTRVVTTSLENKSLAVDAFVEAAKQRVEADIRTEAEQYRQELTSHEDESEKRKNALIEETKRRFAELEETHTREMADIEHSLKSPNDAKVIERCRSLKQQVTHLHSVLAATKENVQALVVTRRQNSTGSHQKLSELCQAMRSMIDGHRETMQDLNNEVTRNTGAHAQELQSLSDQLANQTDGLHQQLENERQATAEAIQQLQKDSEDAQFRYRSTFTSMGDSLQKLVERHRLEIERLKKRHEHDAHESSAKIEQAHCESMALRDDQTRSRETILGDMAQEKSQHELEINHLSSEQGQDIKGITDEFNKQLQALQDETDACLDGGNQETKRNRALLQQLLDEQASLLANYAKIVSDYDTSHGEQIASLNDQNEREIHELKTKNQSEADSQIAADDSECASLQQNLDADYAKHQAEFSEAYKSHVSSIEGLRQERSQIEEIIATFRMAYQKEQDELDAIIAPDVDGAEVFVTLDAGIEALSSQKDKLLQQIGLQKKSLKAEWDAKFTAENDRHALHVVQSAVGTERERHKLALLQEISDVAQSQKDEERDLEDLLNQMNQEHLRMTDHFREELSKARTTEETERLRADKEYIRSTYFDQIDQQKQMTQKFEVQSQERIVTETRRSAQEGTEVSEQIKSARSQFETQKRELESQSRASRSQFTQSYSQIQSDAKIRIQQIGEAHVTRMTRLRKEFETLKDQMPRNEASFRKRMKDSNSEWQSSLDEYARICQCEAEKRAREWGEMVKFFDEKIVVLTKRKNDIMLAFQQRPPRQSEVTAIQQLEGLLQTKTMQLQNAIRDLQEYRSLRQQQEKDASHRFGKPPKVGVLPLAVKTMH
jgi:hypothetical protein